MSQETATIEGPPQRTERPLNRTISPIAGGWRGLGAGRLPLVAALVAGLAALAAAGASRERAEPQPAPVQAARQIVPFEAVRAKEPAPSPDQTDLLLSDEGQVFASLPRGGGEQVPAPVTGPQQPPTPPSMLAINRSAQRVSPGFAAMADRSPPPGDPEAPRPNGKIARLQARPLGDLNMMLLAGSLLPCILETALDSTLPGQASCLVAHDIYSSAGTVVLLEKGTRVLGEHRAGLRQGQRRLFIVWTRAVTPAGVAIELASPAADPQGRSGMDGEVDTRFWDRFGGAVLMSVLEAGVAEAGREIDRRWLSEPSDAASVALRQSADIAPVLRKAAGAEVAIFTAADLDFTPVYQLKAR
ncbi:hypothetical protein ASE17_20565 [Phenylobacterium sp. Root77]|jgi:type IV secretion system protein VirB10|uniref:TrbI/VirB10 family protein n=1 Tax=unclassified Phenylobacterium TaxID=2640670 RepID=UPI0006F87DD5|nr:MULTISPECIES: TrbI/VirB10 family protein [unclassified Phenylobacterium]KQW67029.1 hypothetical protein ASC73_18040 [Phenylobacterium sp. Root1277]KQW89722.1 hypothetical protein ASC79_18945 [Phenylobacterium sp. Root1290]KRC43589.1 hypothetical protein ASE17_20565 [Phenylobacterium sp. Root77]